MDAEDEGKLLTLDATDPRVLRLPWELLADVGGHIFSQGIGVRRRLQQDDRHAGPRRCLAVRMLLVVSRPDDVSFLDPRSDAWPLLDALDELGERVEVEFLYPPTVDALSKRLRDRKAPPVHMVHFDGHGVYDAPLGLGYLLFENDNHTGDRVDATPAGHPAEPVRRRPDGPQRLPERQAGGGQPLRPRRRPPDPLRRGQRAGHELLRVGVGHPALRRSLLRRAWPAG